MIAKHLAFMRVAGDLQRRRITGSSVDGENNKQAWLSSASGWANSTLASDWASTQPLERFPEFLGWLRINDLVVS